MRIGRDFRGLVLVSVVTQGRWACCRGAAVSDGGMAAQPHTTCIQMSNDTHMVAADGAALGWSTHTCMQTLAEDPGRYRLV